MPSTANAESTPSLELPSISAGPAAGEIALENERFCSSADDDAKALELTVPVDDLSAIRVGLAACVDVRLRELEDVLRLRGDP